MNKLKVNRRDFIELINIEKILFKKNGEIWIYRKEGYPKIYKCLEGIDTLKIRLVNLGYQLTDFKIENENDIR